MITGNIIVPPWELYKKVFTENLNFIHFTCQKWKFEQEFGIIWLLFSKRIVTRQEKLLLQSKKTDKI